MRPPAHDTHNGFRKRPSRQVGRLGGSRSLFLREAGQIFGAQAVAVQIALVPSANLTPDIVDDPFAVLFGDAGFGDDMVPYRFPPTPGLSVT